MPPSPKRSSNLESANKKRSRKSVTLETKLEILRRIDAGEKIVDVCKSIGLAKSTVQTIRDNKEKIKEHSQSAASLSVSKLTRQRSSIMEKMENLLIIWIEDNNQRRMPMSQMTIQEKAKNIFENLNSGGTDESIKNVTFQGSRGWFEKFKNRHNLHNLKMKGEAANADDDAAKEYPNILKSIIERGGYRPEQVFNVDETGLYWKRRLYWKPEPEPAVCPQLTLKHLSNALSYFEQGINVLLQNDPDIERSARVCRGIKATITCYEELKKEAESKEKQTTLDQFFKPGQSTTAESDEDDDSILQFIDASYSSSD